MATRSGSTYNSNERVSNTTVISAGPSGPSGDREPQAQLSRHLTGYQGPANYLPYERPPPTFNDTETSWPKYKEELRLYIREQSNQDIFTSTFSEEEDRHIYYLLIRGVGPMSFDLISNAHRDQGKEAFKFLDNYYMGSEDARCKKTITALTRTRMMKDEPLIKFIARMHRLELDCIHHNIFPKPLPGKPSILVGQIITNLPNRYHDLRRELQRDRLNYPSLRELTAKLTEENYIQQSEIDSNPDSVSAVRPQEVSGVGTHTPAATGTGRRYQRGRGRGRVGRRQQPRAATADANTVAAAATAYMPGRPAATHHRRDTPNHPQPYQGQRGPSRGRGRGRGAGPPYHQRNHPYKDSRPPVSCGRCLSRDKSHTSDNCPSRKWCETCSNASHDGNYCNRRSYN